MNKLVWSNDPPTEPGLWLMDYDGDVYAGAVTYHPLGPLYFQCSTHKNFYVKRSRCVTEFPGARWCRVFQPDQLAEETTDADV